MSKGMLVGAEVAPPSPAPFDFAWSKTDANSLSYGDDGTACSERRLCGDGCGGGKGRRILCWFSVLSGSCQGRLFLTGSWGAGAGS